MNTPRDSSSSDQDDANSSASFAHSLIAPLDTANTIHNISLALNNGNSGTTEGETADGDTLMTDVSNVVQSAIQEQHQLHQPESRMAVAELLVSLSHNRENDGPSQDGGAASFVSVATGMSPTKQQSPMYRTAVDYVGSVRKAYENNPKIYTEFLSALEQYHGMSLPIDQLVRTVMTLFQDQPDLLLGFKEFLPEAQGLMNQLVPPMMYSDYKGSTSKAPAISAVPTPAPLSTSTNPAHIPGSLMSSPVQQQGNSNTLLNNGHAAADFLSLIKELSQNEPDMYQHLITLLRKFQKDHSYANFLPTAISGLEVTEPRIISKAPPEELVVSPDFIEAKDFVQTVKYEAKSDMTMYDRFIFALEKYQRNGWTIEQVYSEVSLIFWNHPKALAGFKQFISSVPPPTQP
ncbi:Transcriptional regulatory protein sin3 [Mortierella sp. GBA43]|nr:Transcriptional regulatory protein sin3 [Mortierella sp. GBA43]